MRVLHVLSALDPRYGGPSFALLGLVAGQKAVGIEASITATHYWELPRWDELDRVADAGCAIHLFHCRPRGVGNITLFSEQLKKDISQCDVVHVHGIWHQEQHLAAAYARKLGKPYVLRPCGMLTPWSLSQGRLKKQLYLFLRFRSALRNAAAMHFTTQRERRSSHRLCQGTHAVVEPNGIDELQYRALPERGTFRQTLQIGSDSPLLLFIGRLHHVKGLDVLLHAVQQLPSVSLAIVGPDNDGEGERLQFISQSLGIAGRVHFVGALAGLKRLAAYRDADLFVLPSRHENFGNTVIEALACGTPVLLSEHVDLCEDLAALKDPNICAVSRLTLADLSRAIDERLSTGRSSDLFDQCRKVAFDQFEWTAIAERWKKHYQAILAPAETP